MITANLLLAISMWCNPSSISTGTVVCRKLVIECYMENKKQSTPDFISTECLLKGIK